MEGDGRGKRPRPEADGDSEEERVEKFFALLRSIREMREQQRRADNSVERKRPKVERAAWTPTFQWEDFAMVSDDGAAGVPAATSRGGGRRMGKEKKEEEGTNLDLRLSL